MKKGFTLIELLVVISIIGILATIVLTSLGGARQKTKDSRTTYAVTQLRTALELFYTDNGHYPDSRSGAAWIGVCSEESSYSADYYSVDFYNDLLPYMPSLAEFEDCQVIYYYSKTSNISSYYQNVCGITPISDEQGYLISYALFDTIHDKFFFWEDTSTGEKYHCRSYQR